MNFLKIALITLPILLTGCQQSELFFKRLTTKPTSTTGEVKYTSNGNIGYFRTSRAQQDRPMSKSENDYIDKINEQRRSLIEMDNEHDREQAKIEAETKPYKPSCSDRAFATYQLMRESAYFTGDYSQVRQWNVNKLIKYCEQTEKKGKK